MLQLFIDLAERVALAYDVMTVPNVQARQYSESGEVYSLITTAIAQFFGEEGLHLLSLRRQIHIERYKQFEQSVIADGLMRSMRRHW
ncbi:MAG: hypothetical protein SFW66_06210 [Gammaproteobacteria bacterium]|nr:hypothetical protein [Gammaproteobacteria bacterium]